MTQTEDRLRDAYRAVVQAVQPEDIPDHPQPRAHRGVATATPRWAGLLMPLGAAAAVVTLVVAAAVLVPRLTASSHPASRGSAAPAAGGATGSLPEFSVVNTGGSLQIVETLTGRVTGTVSAPSGQSFTGAAGAADDKTFIVTADLNPQTSCQTFLYKLTLTGTGQPSTLSQLRYPAPAAGLPTALALTADGSVAALSVVTCATGTTTTIGNSQPIGAIYLIDLGAGQVTRTWSYTLGMDSPSDLSLSADGSQLAFSTYVNAKETVGWVLPTTAASGPAATAGRIVVRQPTGRYAGVDATVISTDGSTLYACTHSGDSPGQLATTLSAYDTSHGQLERVLHTWTAVTDLSCGLAANPADGYLLIAREHPAGQPTGQPTGQPPTRSGKRQVAVDVQALSTTTGSVTDLPIRLLGPTGSGSIAW